MQVSVTFRHMEATDAIKEYAREKVEKIRKYFPDPIAAHVVCAVERGYQHEVDVNIQLHNGIMIKGKEVTEDMYSSIDLVMAKIERQVRRYKDRIRHHKARPDLSELPVAYSILQEQEGDGGGAPEPAQVAEAQTPPTIIQKDKIIARPLTVDEAVMQMNLLQDDFLVFRNIGTGEVNVVYRRDDGNYGLIETGPTS